MRLSSPPARAVGENPMYTKGSQAQDEVNLGTVDPAIQSGPRSTVSNLDTTLDRGSVEECACC